MTPTPWQRRFRKLAVLAGTLSSLYLLANYTFDRLRESRIRSLKDREIKDRLKSHFTSLLSTISFTLYALLPTLQPQLLARYPVEETSQALQGMSMTSSTASLGPEQAPSPETPNNSLHLNKGESEAGTSVSGDEPSSAVGESWASEFRRRDGDSGDRAASSERDDVLSSVTSQSISLPPTDLSSDTTSPPSHLSASVTLSPSPPRRPPQSVSKSKKELWRDLKVQSIAKTLTTAYVVPLLLLLTSAQLSTLARIKYMKDVETSLPGHVSSTSTRRPNNSEDEEEVDTPVKQVKQTRGAWLSYFSVESMGLADFVEETSTSTSTLATLGSYLPEFQRPAPTANEAEETVFDADEEDDKAEAERLFLTFSWWLLHEGWKGIADRVDQAVERVFANMPLKRELSPEDWQVVMKEARAIVETEEDGEKLFDFSTLVLPTYPLETLPADCPLPTIPEASPYLMDLLEQTRSQMSSPDARHLIDKGVTDMTRSVIETLRSELYTSEDLQPIPSRRLVDCLPELNRWAKGVWEGVPDSGVEGVLSLPDFESFAALCFGDWA